MSTLLFPIALTVCLAATEASGPMPDHGDAPLDGDRIAAPVTATQPNAELEIAAEPDVILDCAPGSYPCGSEWCTPDGGVCCASVGHPEGYCNAGSVCCASGTCSPSGACDGGSGGDDGGDGGGGGGGGGGCDPDDLFCGDVCCPGGSVCGASGSGQCCPSDTPYHCPSEGWCYELPGSCGSGGGGNSGGGGSGGDSGSGYACASSGIATGSCSTIESCVSEADPCSGYYEANGQRFVCGDICDESSLEACAQAAVDYCVGSGGGAGGGPGGATGYDWDEEDDDEAGCSIAPSRGAGTGGFPLALCLLLASGAVLRRLKSTSSI
jgi:hypothetical protein